MEVETCNVCFVILHYLVMEETEKCIESIQNKIDTGNYQIIIVDNHSNNGSGKKLSLKYQADPKIHVIINEKNLGYSGGNNVGYAFAKHNLGSQFIVVMNNDTMLRSGHFFSHICEDYRVRNAAVIGPRIYTYEDQKRGQNPYYTVPLSKDQIIRKISKKRWDLMLGFLLSYFAADHCFFKAKHQLGRLVKKKVIVPEEYYETIHENVGLHGCCWIFTPVFVNAFDGLREITFMYHEEAILYLQMMEVNKKMLYDPRVVIFHAEKAATKKTQKRKSQSRRLRYRREITSLNRVIEFYTSSKLQGLE